MTRRAVEGRVRRRGTPENLYNRCCAVLDRLRPHVEKMLDRLRRDGLSADIKPIRRSMRRQRIGHAPYCTTGVVLETIAARDGIKIHFILPHWIEAWPTNDRMYRAIEEHNAKKVTK